MWHIRPIHIRIASSNIRFYPAILETLLKLTASHVCMWWQRCNVTQISIKASHDQNNIFQLERKKGWLHWVFFLSACRDWPRSKITFYAAGWQPKVNCVITHCALFMRAATLQNAQDFFRFLPTFIIHAFTILDCSRWVCIMLSRFKCLVANKIDGQVFIELRLAFSVFETIVLLTWTLYKLRHRNTLKGFGATHEKFDGGN